jgi:hypothetical protein
MLPPISAGMRASCKWRVDHAGVSLACRPQWILADSARPLAAPSTRKLRKERASRSHSRESAGKEPPAAPVPSPQPAG